MPETSIKRLAAGVRLALGIFYVLSLLTTAVLLSESGTSTPPMAGRARRLRHVVETPRQRLWKDLLYVAMVGASMPFTLLEAACRAGSTIMVEARKKS